MKTNIEESKFGFTLVEIMVVVSVVIVLLSIVMASILQARQVSRDNKRVADLANIEFALTIEKERNREYPEYAGGAEIGTGEASALDTVIRELNGSVYADPLSEGPGSQFNYVYDSDFTCSSLGQVVLYATEMEKENGGNFDTLCTHSAADASLSNSYVVILK